ncbi:AMP-binding protein [Carboxylicivirga sp. N1Y90]|uniref:AMP-binding protein n=1 Tax=Carboxylicivirga fragile TaxID=3417571 RepID=UPI003D3492D6|nr:AMP-binding protein [Marinilabiliaceae bacterium N1Y90]
MKQHHPIIIQVAKIFFSFIRVLLSLRYKVEVKGGDELRKDNVKFLLPNHQAIMDPVLLFAHLYKYTTAVPVVTATYYDMPVAKTMFSAWGTVRVSDLESGSRNTNVLDQVVGSVKKGFELKKNIVLYPSGQIAGQGYEKIFNKQSAYKIVKDLPENVEVIAVRINGLWGSRWSRAWAGKSPNFVTTLLKCMGIILVNLIILSPRRKIKIEIENITTQAKKKSTGDRTEFNQYLENVYNVHGSEPVNFLKYYFFSPQLKRSLPERIAGSEEDATSQTSDMATEDIPNDVLKLVKLCIAEKLEITSEEIKQSDFLQLDLGADSLNMVEILSEIENNFPTFSAPQINEIKTVADVCLAAMGQFKTAMDLPSSNLQQPLSAIHDLYIDDKKSITELLKMVMSSNTSDPFVYDAMLGSTNRKTFFLKACVVSEFLKDEIKEKHVGIMLPALQSTTLLIAACYLAGKIPVMLNWTVGNKVLEHCIETSQITKILSAGTFIDKVKELLPDSIHSKLILLEKKVPTLGLGIKLKGALKSKLPFLIKNPKLDDTAVVLFTSGSETMPKAVPLSHKNIVSDLAAVFNLVDLSNNETFLSFLPPFHSFGFTVLSILPLISGVKTAYTPNPTDAREVIRVLKHVQANLLIGTPSFLKLLLSESSSYHLKSVHYAISGAEAMPASLKKQFEEMTNNALILEGYGITECAPVLSLNPREKQKLNSVGKLLPGIEGIILDPETSAPKDVGQPGMIYVSGPNVFDGYINNEDLKPFKTINGKRFYKTGDLGYFDDEGFLFITGRLKRFIKIAGEMISLPFIEKVLLEKYGEEDKQVLAVEGSDKTTPAQIVLFTSKNINLKEANEHLLANGIAAIAKIKTIETIDEIPVLGTGKVNYKVLKALIEN